MSREIAENDALPKGWQRVRLGEVGVIHSGGTPSTQDDSNWNGDILWLTPSEVTKLSGKYINSTKRKITPKGLSSTTLLPPRCLIVCTRATIGDCCINVVPMAINQGFKCIRPHRIYSVTFLYYAFQLLKPQLVRLSCGNTFGEISKKDFENIFVKLPPFPEQKAIASLLEKWDAAIEKTEALLAAKEKQFKWLLKRLISDQQDNPEWRNVRLRDTCEIITSPVDKKIVDGELSVKLCNYTDVYYNNTIDSNINFMTATAKPREIEIFSLIKGDVIITKDSETPDDIGVPAYVKETIRDLLCGYHLAILRPKEYMTGKYICYALTSPRIKNDFYRFANGITRFGLTNESYQKIKIPLPFVSEQKRISNILDTAKKEMELLEQLAEQYRIQKRGLMQKLLTGDWRIALSFPSTRESMKAS